MRRSAGHNIFQPQKLADTMLNMHNQLTDRQRRHISNKIFGRNLFGRPAVLALAENILLRNQAKPVTAKTMRQIHHHQHNMALGFFDGAFPIIGKDQIFQPVFAHQREHAFARPLGIAADNPPEFFVLRQISFQLIINLPGIDVFAMGKIPRRQNPGIDNIVIFRQIQRIKHNPFPPLENIFNLFRLQIEQIRTNGTVNIFLRR